MKTELNRRTMLVGTGSVALASVMPCIALANENNQSLSPKEYLAEIEVTHNDLHGQNLAIEESGGRLFELHGSDHDWFLATSFGQRHRVSKLPHVIPSWALARGLSRTELVKFLVDRSRRSEVALQAILHGRKAARARLGDQFYDLSSDERVSEVAKEVKCIVQENPMFAGFVLKGGSVWDLYSK